MPARKILNPDLPLIQDALHFEFRKRQYKSLEKIRKGIFHVSDYAGECMRKSYYDHMVNIPIFPKDTESMSILWAGEALHQILDGVYNEETPLAWDIINQEEPNDDSDAINVIYGECDAVYTLPDGKKVIVDYKTWKSKGFSLKSPKDTHVRQINIYKYLIAKSKNEDIKYGSVIYLDHENRFIKPQIFVFELLETDDIEIDLKAKQQDFNTAYNTGKLPKRTKTWLCDGYCPHTERCAKEDILKKDDLNKGLRCY